MHMRKLIHATKFIVPWAYNKGFKPCRVTQSATVLCASSKSITLPNSFISKDWLPHKWAWQISVTATWIFKEDIRDSLTISNEIVKSRWDLCFVCPLYTCTSLKLQHNLSSHLLDLTHWTRFPKICWNSIIRLAKCGEREIKRVLETLEKAWVGNLHRCDESAHRTVPILPREDNQNYFDYFFIFLFIFFVWRKFKRKAC